MSTDETIATRCPVCEKPLQETDRVVLCDTCSVPQHAACWEATHHCATPGCAGNPVAAEPLMPAPPPSATYAPPPASILPPPPAFPTGMQAQMMPTSQVPLEFSLRAAYAAGKQAFAKQMWTTIGAGLLAFVIIIAASVIPIVNIAGALLVVGPLNGGFLTYLMMLHGDTKPEVNTIFSGYQNLGRWVILQLLMMLIGIVVAIPYYILFFISMFLSGGFTNNAATQTTASIVLMIVSVLYILIVTLVIYPRLMFVQFAVADGYEPMDAIKRSIAMTAGRSLRLIGYGFVLGLLAMAGALGLLVGLIFTIPLSACCYSYLYLAVKSQQPDRSIL